MPEQNFIELASFVAPPPETGAPRGRVIKNPQIVASAGHSVMVCEEGDGQPTLILRKKGDEVIGFDLVCPCGRTTTVNLEFQEE
jgi:hypothetical protein